MVVLVEVAVVVRGRPPQGLVLHEGYHVLAEGSCRAIPLAQLHEGLSIVISSGLLGVGDCSGGSSLGQLVSVSEPELAEGGGGGLDFDRALTDARQDESGQCPQPPIRCRWLTEACGGCRAGSSGCGGTPCSLRNGFLWDGSSLCPRVRWSEASAGRPPVVVDEVVVHHVSPGVSVDEAARAVGSWQTRQDGQCPHPNLGRRVHSACSPRHSRKKDLQGYTPFCMGRCRFNLHQPISGRAGEA